MKALLASLIFVAACGGGGTSPPADAAKNADTAPSGFTLTVKNYENWCDVTLDGTKFVASAPPVKTYTAGAVASLLGDMQSTSATFVWGYWVGKETDDSTHDTSMTKSLTMTSDRTIQACCPFANAPTTPCPAP